MFGDRKEEGFVAVGCLVVVDDEVEKGGEEREGAEVVVVERESGEMEEEGGEVDEGPCEMVEGFFGMLYYTVVPLINTVLQISKYSRFLSFAMCRTPYFVKFDSITLRHFSC